MHSFVTKVTLVWFILFCFACGLDKTEKLPEGVLSRKRMVLVISDLQLLDAAQKSVTKDSKTQERMRDTSYTIVFNKYSTTAAQFDSSLRTYARNPLLLSEVMEDVAQNINTFK
ncbi:MAG: hypothetical protein ACJA19_000218 [Bacteroidia bacterium]|jgi:hypothetical protein|tara:strand:- start:1466 stop:1807 length:342 start_codon:yes stop_codon:yes gene_type:complete